MGQRKLPDASSKTVAIGDGLRVLLDPVAQQNFETMASKLRGTEPHIKFNASQFVSFVVTDFFQTYFEKDFEVLVARFFDSKEYVASELRKAKDSSEMSQILSQSMLKVQQMDSLKNRGIKAHRRKQKTLNPSIKPGE